MILLEIIGIAIGLGILSWGKDKVDEQGNKLLLRDKLYNLFALLKQDNEFWIKEFPDIYAEELGKRTSQDLAIMYLKAGFLLPEMKSINAFALSSKLDSSSLRAFHEIKGEWDLIFGGFDYKNSDRLLFAFEVITREEKQKHFKNIVDSFLDKKTNNVLINYYFDFINLYYKTFHSERKKRVAWVEYKRQLGN